MFLAAIPWPLISLAVGGLFVLVTVLAVRNAVTSRIVATSPEERAELAHLPMTPLQKRAWWGLLVGLALAVAAVGIVASVGPTSYFDDGDLRIVVTLLVMGTLGSHVYVVLPLGRAMGSALDERDKRVVSMAPHLQAAACLVTVAAWSIGLTEVFRGQTGIPTGYMNLLFWSMFLAYALSHSMGVLLGYWWIRNHAEG